VLHKEQRIDRTQGSKRSRFLSLWGNP